MNQDEKSSVTVVCACRNEFAHIGSLLASLDAQNRDNLILDVIIADGMSGDGTRTVLGAHPSYRVIDNPGRIVSTGINAAIRLSTAEFIVRVDAHTVYEPDYVARSIEVIRATGAQNVGGPQRSRAKGFWQRAIDAGFHSPFATGGARFRNDDYTGIVDTVPYGCWRRDYLMQIGLFDESLVRNQDDELNMRIRAAGGRIWQDSSIVSWYSPRSSLAAVFRQYFQYGFWRVAVLRKHPRSAAIRHFVPAVAMLIALIAFALAAGGLRWPLFALLATYLLLSLWASLEASRRNGWDLFPWLPFTFAAYQGAYAIGFCSGLLYWFTRSGRNRQNTR